MEVRIELVMRDGGQFSVSAPFENRALCYGMLEMARDVIQQRSEALQQSRVVVATDMPTLNGSR